MVHKGEGAGMVIFCAISGVGRRRCQPGQPESAAWRRVSFTVWPAVAIAAAKRNKDVELRHHQQEGIRAWCVSSVRAFNSADSA